MPIQINKTINLNAVIKLKNAENNEVMVASLNGSIGENNLNYSINVNIIDATLITLNETNKASYLEQKTQFENEVKSNLLV